MKISPVNKNSPVFSKKLVATGAYLQNGEPQDCKIYRLEKQKDFDYFKKLGKANPNWIRMGFYWTFRNNFDCKTDTFLNKTYVVENNDDFSLGHYLVFDNVNNSLNLDFIETYQNPNYKYIGETMISYLATRAKQDNKFYIHAASIVDSSEGFYRRNNFEIVPNEKIYVNDAFLSYEDYDKVIQRNFNHTGKKVELII